MSCVVIFRPMVNLGSIPEGEQMKCSSELKRTFKFSGVLYISEQY